MWAWVILCCCFPLACCRNCEPEDEFPNGETTSEWNSFMDDLYDRTFRKNYTKPCKQMVTDDVVIDETSDFLWDLRFVLYNVSKDGRTVDGCFGKFEGEGSCDRAGFRECMKDARIAMLEVLAAWDERINEELKMLADAC